MVDDADLDFDDLDESEQLLVLHTFSKLAAIGVPINSDVAQITIETVVENRGKESTGG